MLNQFYQVAETVCRGKGCCNCVKSALRTVSRDKILRFKNTFISIIYKSVLPRSIDCLAWKGLLHVKSVLPVAQTVSRKKG